MVLALGLAQQRPEPQLLQAGHLPCSRRLDGPA